MEDIARVLFFGFIFIFIIPFILLILYLVRKGKKQAWKGEIIDKRSESKRDFDTNRVEVCYKVVIKLESGKEKHMEVDKERYDRWNIGDKLEKKSGELWPEKI